MLRICMYLLSHGNNVTQTYLCVTFICTLPVFFILGFIYVYISLIIDAFYLFLLQLSEFSCVLLISDIIFCVLHIIAVDGKFTNFQ
jgi:hypothetical protein